MARIKPYFEDKYLPETAQIYELLNLLKPLTSADSHGESGNYEILSIYYDTPALDFFNDKIHGLNNKVKVRLRFYRNFAQPQWHNACIEIKERNGNLVTKHRVELKQTLHSGHYLTDPDFSIREQMLQTLKDAHIAGQMAGKVLVPAIMVYYKRKALQFTGIDGLRFTLDSEIAGLRPSASVFSQDFNFSHHSAISQTHNVFEIKAYATPPASILGQLETRGIRQQSFSKYSTSLQTLLERTNDGRSVI